MLLRIVFLVQLFDLFVIGGMGGKYPIRMMVVHHILQRDAEFRWNSGKTAVFLETLNRFHEREYFSEIKQLIFYSKKDCSHQPFPFAIIVELCSHYDSTGNKSLLFISFGSGSKTYSTKTPADLNFTTEYIQSFGPKPHSGIFGLVNIVSQSSGTWHDGALDHTENDVNGYMLLVDFYYRHYSRDDIFKITINNLHIGLYYLFSAYMANITPKRLSLPRPKVIFEVWGATIENQSIAQCTTDPILDYDVMTWTKYSLLFIASSSSVVLALVSDLGEVTGKGDDLVIDDIELLTCFAINNSVCSSGQYQIIDLNLFGIEVQIYSEQRRKRE